MATKKSHPPAKTPNGEPVAEEVPKEPRPARMTKAQLERRVHVLEDQIARLKAELEEIRGPEVPWWKKIVGSHADDPAAFEEAMRLGREWRESFRPQPRSPRRKPEEPSHRMVVLDTDSLSILQLPGTADQERLLARLEGMGPDEIATTVVIYEEQTRGWMNYKARAKTISQEIAAYAKLRKHIEDYRTSKILDFDEAAAAELQRFRSLKIRVGTMDLKIAAITIVHDATLLTRNLVDFRKVPGLKVEDWTS